MVRMLRLALTATRSLLLTTSPRWPSRWGNHGHWPCSTLLGTVSS